MPNNVIAPTTTLLTTSTMQNRLLYMFWNVVTKVGMRRLGHCVQTWYPTSRCYNDSIFYVMAPPPPPPPPPPVSSRSTSSSSMVVTSHRDEKTANDDDDDYISQEKSIKATTSQQEQQQRQYVALTIDDGLCRGVQAGDGCSMVQDVCAILKEFDSAKATFFVCTDYTKPEEAHILLQHGHELGNHLQEDISGYYCNLSKHDFRSVLLETNHFLETKVLSSSSSTTVTKDDNEVASERDFKNTIHPDGHRQTTKIKWFRAPQGRMSVAMQQVLAEEGMVNVMGDCYCDDWSFTQALDKQLDPIDVATSSEEDTKARHLQPVVDLMLRQVQPGSIAILHMPERGFRESMTIILKAFLHGCKERNLHCVTLSELERRYNL